MESDEAVEEYGHIDVEDAEDVEDGVETREGKGGWVGVVKG